MNPLENNFYRCVSLIVDEIPKKLRIYFKECWDLKYPNEPWDDTPKSGSLFMSRENNRIVKKKNGQQISTGDRHKWDGTPFFQILLHSSQMFLKQNSNERRLIDDLRDIRNSCYGHKNNTQLDDKEFRRIFREVKTIFVQMGWSIEGIDKTETKSFCTFEYKELERKLARKEGVKEGITYPLYFCK